MEGKNTTSQSPVFKGSIALSGLKDLKATAGVVSAAPATALEGQTGATAVDISECPNRDFGTQVSAPDVGLFLRNNDVGSTLTHGKLRFVLDADQR